LNYTQLDIHKEEAKGKYFPLSALEKSVPTIGFRENAGHTLSAEFREKVVAISRFSRKTNCCQPIFKKKSVMNAMIVQFRGEMMDY
jgi:hypothetical protein